MTFVIINIVFTKTLINHAEALVAKRLNCGPQKAIGVWHLTSADWTHAQQFFQGNEHKKQMLIRSLISGYHYSVG